MNKKIMWYAWFSVPAFLLLFFDSSIRVLFCKPLYEIKDGHKLNLNIRLFGNAFLLWGIHLMILPLLFVALINWLSRIAPYLHLISDWLNLFFIYSIGIYITYKHTMWRKENIPHYLWKRSDDDASCS